MTDRRSRRTDDAIRTAFLKLLFSVRYDTITMSRIASEADISRSTLYRRFGTREDVLKASMDRIIENLADGLSGRTDLAGVMPLVDHFWENRRLSRTVFGPPIDALVRRWLSDAIELKLLQSTPIEGSAKVAAIKSSAGAISLLEQWMSGHLDLPREAIGEALVGAPIA